MRRVNMITSELRPRRHTCRRHHTRARRHNRFLEWSEHTISFGQEDHPDHIASPGRMPLVTDPLIGGYRFSKVLMDGGSGINILYISSLHKMGIPLDVLRPSATEFVRIVPGQTVEPIGQITLEVTFGVLHNYRCELICFEVVPFPGGYDAVLGRTAFAKFMAIPCYAYMKLKMPGPYGIITINSNPQHALEAEAASLIQAEARLARTIDGTGRTAATEAVQAPERRPPRYYEVRRPHRYSAAPRPCVPW